MPIATIDFPGIHAYILYKVFLFFSFRLTSYIYARTRWLTECRIFFLYIYVLTLTQMLCVDLRASWYRTRTCKSFYRKIFVALQHVFFPSLYLFSQIIIPMSRRSSFRVIDFNAFPRINLRFFLLLMIRKFSNYQTLLMMIFTGREEKKKCILSRYPWLGKENTWKKKKIKAPTSSGDDSTPKKNKINIKCHRGFCAPRSKYTSISDRLELRGCVKYIRCVREREWKELAYPLCLYYMGMYEEEVWFTHGRGATYAVRVAVHHRNVCARICAL